MSDYIVNRDWAFDDSEKSFGVCKNCNSRWYKTRFTSTDSKTWTPYETRQQAFEQVKLV
jgi:hypothetical protein